MPAAAVSELLLSEQPEEKEWLRGTDNALLRCELRASCSRSVCTSSEPCITRFPPVPRINHLKAVSVAQERQIQVLTANLAGQHEMLHEVAARVAQVVSTIPPPDSLAGAPLLRRATPPNYP